MVDGNGNAHITGKGHDTWGSPITPFHVASEVFVSKLAGPHAPLPDVFITSIKSRSAKPGSRATILGGGFDTSPRMNFVYFNGYKARVNEAKQTSLKVTIPKRLQKGLADVYVIVGGITSNTVQFQVN